LVVANAPVVLTWSVRLWGISVPFFTASRSEPFEELANTLTDVAVSSDPLVWAAARLLSTKTGTMYNTGFIGFSLWMCWWFNNLGGRGNVSEIGCESESRS